jgi:hypothetical protein
VIETDRLILRPMVDLCPACLERSRKVARGSRTCLAISASRRRGRKSRTEAA